MSLSGIIRCFSIFDSKEINVPMTRQNFNYPITRLQWGIYMNIYIV